jgi:hypothetical protein
MTPDDRRPDDHHDDLEPAAHAEIDALLDGEAVDKSALRATLNDPAARDYLIDALVLRQLAREMTPSRFVVPGQRRVFTRVARWAAAVVMLVAGASAGYVYGQRTTPAMSSQGSIEVVADPAPPPAPAPTRSIRFEPGVNWTSDTRSH